ncbi:MAG: FKBP-type peptidyl-prolyl cis-trans isomerase [Sphingobacteriales bacterium]|jgi:FKBP-type peptidyl-prolyl cis-trans isomerase FklB|nr:MAG: FKBP-type peptidyl-prolyl cis-trans isomerase [Sphingobacteriales bacterium]
MKKSILLAVALVSVTAATAQTKPAPKPKPVVKPAAAAPVLKSAIDSFSYSIGLSIANFYKQQGITKINTNMVSKAINDATANKKTLLTEEEMNMSISNYLQKLKSEKSAANRKAGEDFLAENKKKPGVITLPSGLQYQIIKEGTGEKPTVNDKVKCHYHGTLLNGTIFDSSVDRGQPIDFAVGGVIQGWVEALQLMPIGSKWKLFIPSNLAYGDNQAGPHIMPGSTLIFDVELIDIVK